MIDIMFLKELLFCSVVQEARPAVLVYISHVLTEFPGSLWNLTL